MQVYVPPIERSSLSSLFSSFLLSADRTHITIHVRCSFIRCSLPPLPPFPQSTLSQIETPVAEFADLLQSFHAIVCYVEQRCDTWIRDWGKGFVGIASNEKSWCWFHFPTYPRVNTEVVNKPVSRKGHQKSTFFQWLETHSCVTNKLLLLLQKGTISNGFDKKSP